MQKMFVKLPIITLVTFLMLGSVASSVKADGTATRTETVCDSSAYGQTNCHQVVVQIPAHVVVDTALPSLNVVMAALFVTALFSGVAYFRTK